MRAEAKSAAMKPDDLIPTRHSLVRRLKDLADETSWQEFFNIYWRLIYSVAIKAGLTEQEAQEVVQETVITVAKNIKGFEVGSEHGSYKAWLLNITRWRIADQFRKRAAVESAVPDETGTGTPLAERLADPATLNLDAVWDEQWKTNLFDAAVERLRERIDPGVFQMFDLHVLKEWPANKVARKLGVNMGRVYFAKYKVTRLLKSEIKRLETARR